MPFRLGLLCLLLLAARSLVAAEPPPVDGRKHITIPFKTIAMGAWAADGSHYTQEIEDQVHGRLTLIMRIARVSETGLTVAADGTDYETTFPLPPESNGAVVLRSKKRELGEPWDEQKSLALVRYLVAAKYFRYAQEELGGLTSLPPAARAELQDAILEGRARLLLTLAAEALQLGQHEDAGRLLTEAQTSLEAPGVASASEKVKAVEQEVRGLQVRLTAEAQARDAWTTVIQQIHKALEGAHADEAAVIDRLRPDLEGPLPAARRNDIVKSLRVDEKRGVNYGQAIELLKEFSFAVRYGEALPRAEVNNLDEFFAAERAIEVYLNGDETGAAARLEKVLAIRGLTDKAFEALVRLGQRGPLPPSPKDGGSPHGPLQFTAPKGELEVPLFYLVQLPVDYHPSQRRPLLLALHGMNAEAKTALGFWAAEANRRGWIVAAPECIIGKGKGYLATPEERGLGIRTVVDCMRRFAVDPARVYVAGHSMGGHMAWDLALTFPGRFAAAAPYIGCVTGVSSNYVPNVFHTPVYCVSGERDTTITKVNRLVNEDLKRQRRPMVYVEYLARGHEGFGEEIPRTVEWLAGKSRQRSPKEVDFVSADMETSQAFWLAMTDNQTKKQTAPVTFETAVRATGIARLSGAAGPNNTVEIKAYNIQGVRIFVTPELFDLAKPLKVTINARQQRVAAFEASRRKVLEFVRETGDRERLYWACVDLAVPR